LNHSSAASPKFQRVLFEQTLRATQERFANTAPLHTSDLLEWGFTPAPPDRALYEWRVNRRITSNCKPENISKRYAIRQEQTTQRVIA